MKLVIRPEATEELYGSAQWYDERKPGLGHDLMDEAWSAIGRITATPTAFGRYEFYRGTENVRRARIVRFPCSVIFVHEPDCIRILAFAPDKRQPLYWLDRLRDAGT